MDLVAQQYSYFTHLYIYISWILYHGQCTIRDTFTVGKNDETEGKKKKKNEKVQEDQNGGYYKKWKYGTNSLNLKVKG